ncbi:meiotic W68 [Arctopsyche grandis]|uniref:meiotic W68 n=1 Tax=Arctopsyche grandis TaxID=121162 RepID=UPI00406D6EAD
MEFWIGDDLAEINDKHIQNIKYVNAVETLYRDFKSDLLKLKAERSNKSSIEKLIATGHCDFNELRQAVKSLSQPADTHHDEESSKIVFYSQKNSLNERSSINNTDGKQVLLDKIEKIIEGVISDIANDQSPKFILRNQRLWNNCIFKERVTLKPAVDSKMLIISFEYKKSTSKFCLILHLLSTIHQMIIKNVTCTRRELYYQNVAKVKNQRSIDVAVSEICCLLDTPQWELGILTTSKGLISGPLEIITHEGHKINCLNSGGVLIPQDIIGIKSVKSNAKFILVIEKDAIFQKLLDEGALDRLKPFIMITGKGYPDINTRLMLKLLVDSLKIPPLALVDGDPYGIEIMCTYRFGSLATAHLASKLAVPSLRWLGIHPSDIAKLSSPSLPLSSKDVSKCKDLMDRPYCLPGSALASQIQILLDQNQKAEIEGIGTMSQAYLTDRYIPHKICAKDLI